MDNLEQRIFDAIKTAFKGMDERVAQVASARTHEKSRKAVLQRARTAPMTQSELKPNEPPPVPNPVVHHGARFSPEHEAMLRVVAFLKANGETHTRWAEYFEAHPDEEAKYLATGDWDDAKEHRRLEAGYREAIEVLDKLWRDRRFTPPNPSEPLVERVRDFIYDCTRDEFGNGWTLSRHQTEDLLKMAAMPAPDGDVVEALVKAARDVRDRFPPVHGCAETDQFPVEAARIRALEKALRPFTLAKVKGDE